MYKILCLVFALVCAVSTKQLGVRRLKRSVHQPVFRDCGNENRIIEFKELTFSPDPIILPGKLTVTFLAENTQTMPNMDIKVKMERKMKLGSWKWDMEIPCIAKVGSCTYRNICHHMREAQRKADDVPTLRKLLQAIEDSGSAAQCPIAPHELNIRNLELDLPEIPSVVSNLADGSFSVTYRLLEHNNHGRELGCLTVDATIATEEDDDDDCWIWC